jgi:hypothetical protein
MSHFLTDVFFDVNFLVIFFGAYYFSSTNERDLYSPWIKFICMLLFKNELHELKLTLSLSRCKWLLSLASRLGCTFWIHDPLVEAY